MGPFPTQKGKTLHNVHAVPFKKVLFVAALPSRPVRLAHKQFGVPKVTYYGYSNMRVLRVLVQNLLCSSAGSCLRKVFLTLVSDLPLTSRSTSLLTLPYSGTARGLPTIFTLLCLLCSHCIPAGDRSKGDKKN